MRQRPPKSSLDDDDDVPEGAFRHMGVPDRRVDQWHNDSLTGSSGDFWQDFDRCGWVRSRRVFCEPDPLPWNSIDMIVAQSIPLPPATPYTNAYEEFGAMPRRSRSFERDLRESKASALQQRAGAAVEREAESENMRKTGSVGSLPSAAATPGLQKNGYPSSGDTQKPSSNFNSSQQVPWWRLRSVMRSIILVLVPEEPIYEARTVRDDLGLGEDPWAIEKPTRADAPDAGMEEEDEELRSPPESPSPNNRGQVGTTVEEQGSVTACSDQPPLLPDAQPPAVGTVASAEHLSSWGTDRPSVDTSSSAVSGASLGQAGKRRSTTSGAFLLSAIQDFRNFKKQLERYLFAKSGLESEEERSGSC